MNETARKILKVLDELGGTEIASVLFSTVNDKHPEIQFDKYHKALNFLVKNKFIDADKITTDTIFMGMTFIKEADLTITMKASFEI